MIAAALPRYSTLPGLRMPFGSSRCLRPRIRSSATGSFTDGRMFVLDHADAVLGGDRAAVLLHHRGHDGARPAIHGLMARAMPNRNKCESIEMRDELDAALVNV